MKTNLITFDEHKERTAIDCEDIAKMLIELAVEIRKGNTDAFDKFWIVDGTEEGDAKIFALREMVMLRYFHRKENLK